MSDDIATRTSLEVEPPHHPDPLCRARAYHRRTPILYYTRLRAKKLVPCRLSYDDCHPERSEGSPHGTPAAAMPISPSQPRCFTPFSMTSDRAPAFIALWLITSLTRDQVRADRREVQALLRSIEDPLKTPAHRNFPSDGSRCSNAVHPIVRPSWFSGSPLSVRSRSVPIPSPPDAVSPRDRCGWRTQSPDAASGPPRARAGRSSP